MGDSSTRTSDSRRRPGNAFATGVVRSIRGSLGRFLAIMGIVALGCGFFAGLQMSGEDMRRASDVFYDGTSLWDLRVISTLGLADEDLDRLKAIEGVEQVMPSTTCDAMARLGGEQIAVRISTIDTEAAKEAEQVSATQIISSKDDYLNRPFLVDGRWPEGADECVIAADKLTGSFGIGDTVEVIGGGDSLDDILESRSLKIVGMASSSNYPYTGSFGSTTLGSGIVAQYLFVTEDALVEDAPYTEAYLLVDGALERLSESPDYDEVVSPVKKRIEDMADELAHERQADLKAKAQEKLDEKIKEYNEELDDAYGKLEDARQELEDAYNQIEDGRQELADGIAAYEQGIEEYNDGVNQLNYGGLAWVNGYNELATQLGNAGIGGASLEELRANVTSKIDEANSGIQQLSDGIAQATDGAAQARAGIAQLNDGIAQTQAGIDGLLQKQVFMGLTEEEQVTLATLQAQLPEMQAQVTYLEGEAAKADGMVQQLSAQRAEVEAKLPQLNEALAGIDRLISTRAELDAAATKLNDSYPELVDAANEIASAREKLDEAVAEYD
ncbi:MAG: ABC transporter permease, partial [Atopobiaceae bacterium]|nr:ABC transporter permease [Atopobiaceae bacterium]